VKRSTVVKFFLVLIVLVVAWQAYRYRVRAETWIWHLRHGEALTVGDYVVPVPVNWYVENEGNEGYLLFRLDTDDHTPYKRLKQHASIVLFSERPMKDEDMNRLLSLDGAYLKKQGVVQRTFSVRDGTIDCVGGDRPGPTGIYDIEPISWHCRSTGGLDLGIGATDPDMKQVWEIVSRIRKKS
jgi:hypothetical protein